jgi:hypothetical protein
MTDRYFCTLFDSGYLLKGLAMLTSLFRFCPDTKVFVLCMDYQTRAIVERLDLPFVVCVTLEEVETTELIQAKADRSVSEYCWTLSSCFTWYVMHKYPQIEFLTYVDADLFFYSDVQPLFDEISEASIAIIEHRFSERLKDREVNGRFCVEWVSFRRDEQGLACLSRWRDQCIEWCYYRLEDGRMGDQKYLDEWPSLYPACHIIMHPGAGIAPWNYSQYKFGHNATGNITVDDATLMFYHFHQFQLIENGTFDRLSTFYTSECGEPTSVYEIYERDLSKHLEQVLALQPGFKAGLKPAPSVVNHRFIPRLVRFFRRAIGQWF